MTKLLLSVHVLAAILAVGSISVAASMFPRYALGALGGDEQGMRSAAIASLLHRICRGYAVAGLAVPVLGIATGAWMGVLSDTWLIASLALTVIAAAILALAILPGQQRLLAQAQNVPTLEAARPRAARLTMITGIFNVLWAIVVVLMIVRPGSTTGA
ncbi:membrane protein [Streptomyces marokkonensis]|uniref:Membrane protein n=1 Tax=Streptomyces marokkonensis TaxID=324855 RepID=A0ABP7PZW5_9ACTN